MRRNAIGRLSLAFMLAAQPLVPQYAFANPDNGIVTHGSASISGTGTNQVTISQSSDRAVIEWDSFSVGQNERVDFHQPSASSVTANKVIGTDPSEILGQLHATGRLILINGNGVVFGENSVIDAASFIASVHDISADEVMNSSDSLSFSGGTGSIINNGNIALRDGGIAALLAPHIVNNGVITARLGTISLGASQSVSIDFYGDGLLSFSADSALTNVDSEISSLIDQQGQIIADGGVIQMSAKTASDVINQSVNIGGLVRAQSVSLQDGRIILSGDTGLVVESDGRLDATGGGSVSLTGAAISHGGTINASATTDGGTISLVSTGKTTLSGTLDASSQTAAGGTITVQAGAITESGTSSLDASGTTSGGSITVTSASSLMSSGSYDASASNGQGGRIDVTATDLRALSASYDASGTNQGGRVRIGGSFQGGKTLDISEAYYDSFVTRWSDSPALANAAKTFANDGTHINVAASDGTGGTAIIWSDVETTFLGSINATGTRGGSVEISSAATLRYASLSNIEVSDGTLLLDPKNITIGSSTEVQSWSYQGLIGRWYLPNVDVADLDTNDNFGGALALSSDSTLLAVGASGDAGANNDATGVGAVYLFTFTNDSFGGGSLAGVIGKDYQNGGNLPISAIRAGDQFGASVALDDNGDRLAVGAPGDDGSGDGATNSGAVYLFSFTDSAFNGGSLVSTIGDGYSDFDVTLDDGDAFGSAVALNDDGSRLVVGAPNDGGSGNVESNSGAVYLMSFSDTDYDSPSLVGTIGVSYAGSDDLALTELDENDGFGSAVALSSNGTRLLVGAPFDDSSGASGSYDLGAAYLFSFENENYKSPTHELTIGASYKDAGDIDIGGDMQDNFGASVALSNNGQILAVGTVNDDGSSASGSNNYGAVSLFTYSSSDLEVAPTITRYGKDYSGTGNLGISALGTGDNFGAAVALNGNGDQIAIGATGGDGAASGGTSNSGEVTLIAISSTPTVSSRIGSGYVANDYENIETFESNENYGVSVSLNQDATRMAVGSINDGGSPDSSTSYGAVALFSFSDSDFSGATLEGTIGYGYAGSKDVNFNSGGGDGFGASVSLNATGDRLAVGETGENNKGAVRLFSFSDANFSSGTLAATIGDGFNTGDDVSVSLDANDEFGAGVSLSDNGRLLAVGAPGDDGTAGSDTGAVYLFRFSDGDFSDGEEAGTMGSGYSDTGDVNVTLASNDAFGSAVSLDADGNRLAVGAINDRGPDAVSDVGAVLLFSFGDTTFTNGTLSATIGDGYTGGNNVNVSNLGKFDYFGSAVALNDTGDRLAVGAPGDDGASANQTGAVYLFSFADSDFGSGALSQLFGQGYTSTDQFDVSYLEAGDAFGTSVAFNNVGDRLIVGALNDDGGTNADANAGVVHLFNAAHSSGGYRAAGQSFGNLESNSITVNAYEVADILARGTSLTLQASNDITVSNAVQVGGFAQSAGDLTLRAGRSVGINESIITNGGDISIISNDTAANGVVAAQRDSGSASITLASGKSLNANSGDVSLLIADASDRTNNSSGDINLASNVMISGNRVTIRNNGPTADSDVIAGTGSQINAASTGDAITLVSNRFSNSAGATVFNASSGRFQLWTTDETGHDMDVLDPDFVQYGATYGTSTIAGGASEDGIFYTDTATVSPNFRYAVSKTYDGSTSATIADANIGVSGANTDETVVLTASAANFDTALVGSGKTVTLTGLSVASASRGTIDVYGYGVSTTSASNANGQISAKSLSLTGQSGQNKTYDTTRTATVSYGSLSGLVGDDAVTLDTSSAANNFDTANVGTGKTITMTNLALSGADAGNYVIGDQTTTADITAASVTLNSATASDKTYDGNTAATITNYSSLSGILGADAVSLDPSSVTASFDNKNVGTGKTVTLSGLAITGADAANYTIASSATTTAAITAKTLGIASATAADRAYDGTDGATISAGSLSGFIGSETVTATASGQFADANVGTGKTVTISYSLADGTNGGLASNYVLADTTDSADITQKALSVIGQSASDRVYDGTDTASVSFTSLSGLVGSQTVTATANGQFADANVGTAKSVSISYSLADGTNGGLASNYNIADTTDSANITPLALSISSASTTDKTYDDSNAITVTAGTLSGLIGSQSLGVSATGTTNDSDAGTGKYVTISYSLSDGTNGGLASNYSLNDGAGSVDITPKTLSYSSVSASDKIYDGDSSATISATGLSGFIGSQTVTSMVQGSFGDANVGTAKSVAITFALADGTNGGKASNYQIADLTRQADITAKALSISGTSAANKTYDATTAASITNGILSGLIGSETLNLSSTGTFSDATVGTGKSVSVSYSLTDGTNGGLASNYSLANESLSADISARALTLTQLNIASKTYDASTSATITNSGTLTNIQGSDDVSLDDSAASATFASANAGTVGVSLSGFSLSGASASNYSLSLPNVTGVITRKPLSISGSKASDKAYDGTRLASILAGTLSGFIGTQTLSVDGVGTFANAAPGMNKPVSVSYILKDGANGGLAANYILSNETLFAAIQGQAKEKADSTAPMVEKQVEIVETDIKIERQEKLEMIEEVELKVLQDTTEATSYVETVGDWVILSCEATGTQQGVCSAR